MNLINRALPQREHLSSDLVAGLTFAVVNIPQAMANALLANVNPILGLRTLLIATPVAAVFTGSVYMNVSTTSALSLATADALFGIPKDAMMLNITVLMLMVGLVQLVAGLFKMGTLVRFVSKSVMIGFTTGIALKIILGQVAGLTGYDSRFSGTVLQFADTVLNWKNYDWATLFIGVLTIGLIVGISYTRFKKISLAVSLIVVTLVAKFLSFDSVQLVGETITGGGNMGSLMAGGWNVSPFIFTSAVAIAIIGMVQGAGVSQSFPNPDGKYPNASKDFFGQGLANMATGLFQGIPAGGSMSGTALVVSAGSRTRWANVFAGLLVLPLVLLFKSFIGLTPMATLAGLLMVVGVQSLHPEEVRTIWYTGQIPRVSYSITLAATLALPLQYAVFVGVAVSFMLYVIRASNQVSVRQLEIVPHGYPIERDVSKTLVDDQTVVLNMYGSLFFAAVANLEQQIPNVGDARRAIVIMRMRGRDEIGSTLISVLHRYARELEANDGRLILCAVNERVYDQMKRTGLVAALGEGGVHRSHEQLGQSLNDALGVVRRWRGSVDS